jgi:DNA repair photolyase
MPLKSTAGNHGEAAKGRGSTINPEGRFEIHNREAVDDGWFQEPPEGDEGKPKTVIAIEHAKSVISRHNSPDVGFAQSINPYRGCGHGCVYCFARPSHAYLGLSPGIDFETKLSAKTNAAEKLREEIAKPGYKCEPLTMAVNTDAYQPIEKKYRITRQILELCHETDHPVSLITKNALIERDLDLLRPMAAKKLVNVTISITTLDHDISRHMEPRTSAPARRLLAVKRLSEAGIPVNVNIAPVIPFLTDHELENIMEAAAGQGARSAFYNLVRLPWEVKDIFRAWLETHFPLKATHVMSRIHEMREGRDNDPNFGTRMTGTGLFAELLRQRYEKALKRFGLDQREQDFELDRTSFTPPSPPGQGRLF